MRITYSFAESLVNLDWRDIRFGLARRLLEPRAAIDKAVQEVAQVEQPCQALLELACSGWCDSTIDLVEGLAQASTPYSEETIERKFLYLSLAWVYSYRTELDNPLDVLEEIYVKFDYPDEIAWCARYMPMQGPELDRPEPYEKRVLARWRQYLDDAAQLYKQRDSP